MTELNPALGLGGTAPRFGLSRRVALALVALAIAVPVTLLGTTGKQESVEAAIPSANDPDVLRPVDLDALSSTPVQQWGVEGLGNTYSAAKVQVWDIHEMGNTIFVAGAFLNVRRNGDDPTSQPILQSYLAAFDRDTGTWIETFRPELNRTVYTVESAPNGMLLVGGEFTSVNGIARTGLVMLNPVTGATITTFTASIMATNQPMVRSILTVGNQIYIGGQLNYVLANGNSYWVWNAARLNATTGGIDGAFVPKFAGGIWDLAFDPSRNQVSAAGFFTSIDATAGTARFGTVSAANGRLITGQTPFETNSSGQKDTIGVAYANDKLYVVGAQHIMQVLDATTHNRVGFATSGVRQNTFTPGSYVGGGDLQTIEATSDGKILIGCHCYGPTYDPNFGPLTEFNTFDNNRSARQFAWDYNMLTNGRGSSFIPGLKQRSYGTYAIETDSRGCYYVGGDYNRTASGAWLGGFGRFCTSVAGVTGLSGSSLESKVNLGWSAAVTQLPVDNYKVYRNGVWVADTRDLSYTVSGGMVNGQSYQFTVRTRDVSGRLSDPVAVSATFSSTADTQAPTLPTNFVGAVSGSDVNLTWNASTDLPASGAGLSGYLVHRDYNYIGFVAAGTQTFSDLGVAAGNHRYEVRAIDKVSNLSPSAVANLTISGPADTQAPTVPGNPTATPVTVPGNNAPNVRLNWSASTDLPAVGAAGLSGYLIHRDYGYVKFIPAGTTTWDDPAVANGVFRYEIRAIDNKSNISAPATVNITVGGPDTSAPNTPANFVASANGSTVTLSWDPATDNGSSGMSGYLVHKDYIFVQFIPDGTTTWSEQGVTAGNHTYQIRAVDKANNYSAPATKQITIP